ncbi:hypothetical protein CALCODRAFT_500129 [Calocera cornea HHB12733]|uniref:EXPERA domain-containing protein n=1 Tax=Calocera cornea HHB12733 TaxID=1353952 RepID=A0A165E6K5_9BASI|nr:hypothetical protein CALCODRAFT_500129 [Calocera cornea HHB12733]
MSRLSTTMQIDITSVNAALLSFAACFTGYFLYSFAMRKARPSLSRLVNELAGIWLLYDAVIHAIVIAFGAASMTTSPPIPPSVTRITLVWQTFAQPSQYLHPIDSIAQTAVLLAFPFVGYAAVMWWRDETRWREGEMVGATLSTFVTVLGFMRFQPERLRDMSPQRRDAALFTWVAFFFLNMLWIVIPLALLYQNYNALRQEEAEKEDGERQTLLVKQ